MSTNSGAQNIDVGSIWTSVRRALPALFLLTLLAGGATYATLALMAPRYEAETQVTITAKSNDPYSTGQNDAGAAATVTPRLDPAAINTHVSAIQAPDLLLKVGNELKLGERAEFNSAIGPIDSMDRITRLLGLGGPNDDESVESRVLSAMRRSLSVSAARESRFISIRFTSIDAALAAEVANAVAMSYRNSLREIPVRETNEAVAALLPKLEQLSREVFEAEAISKRFRAESDQLTGGSASLTLQQQRLSALSSDLVTAEAERSKSEARLAAARELALRGGADTLPEVQQSRIIQDLMAQKIRVERQVNEAEAVLLPAHPRMRQLNADLNGLRRTLDNEIRTIVSSISKEVRLSQLRTEQLREQIAVLKQSAVNNSGDEAKLRALETTAQSKRNELERLQKQLEDNRTVVDTNRVPVESTIVSMARPSATPVFPKKGSYTMLAMAAAFMLGLSLVIARALMLTGGDIAHNRRATDRATAARERATPRHPERATDTVHSTAGKLAGVTAALGALSRKNAKQERAAADAPNTSGAALPGPVTTAPHNRPQVAGMEAPMAAFADHFLSLAPDDGGYRLLIAGATDGLDPSNEAIELVAELSDAGARVLLIDWTLTGERLLTEIETGDAASLADLMIGNAEFEDILVPLPDSNVHYVFAANLPNQRQLLDESGLNLVLDALDEAYDVVVLAGRFSDACAIFETIEGRFDAGLTVAEASVGVEPEPGGSFLGFAVTDIEIVHYVRSVRQTAARVATSALGHHPRQWPRRADA